MKVTEAQKRYTNKARHFRSAQSAHDAVFTRGITSAARRLDVSYNHLWKVLTGVYNSPSLLLKVERMEPSLLTCSLCNIDYKKILDDARGRYEWNEAKQKFVKIKEEM